MLPDGISRQQAIRFNGGDIGLAVDSLPDGHLRLSVWRGDPAHLLLERVAEVE